MKSYYELEDIYYNFLINFEELYLDKYIKQLSLKYNNYIKPTNYYYGLINDKIQFICNCIGNDKRNKYTLVYYYSPKYESYKIVLLKQYNYNILYGNNYNNSNPFINGIYIYGKQLLKNINYIDNTPPAFNVNQLDVYYDTIFTLNEYKYFNVEDYNDKIFFNKFGNEILPLLTLPIEANFDFVNNNVNTYNLYNDTEYILKEKNYSIDDNIPYNDNIIITEDKINYNFSKLLYNYKYPNSLSTHHIYMNLIDIYNYINNDDINNNEYDIISINNEYSIIAGKMEEESYNLYNIYYTNYNYSYEPNDINVTYILTSSDYSKDINLVNYTLFDYKNVLGEKVYNDLDYIFKYIDIQIYNEDTNLIENINELNIGEYLNIIDILNMLNVKNLKNEVQNSDNAINNIYLDLTNVNSLNFSSFRLLGNNIFFRTDINNVFTVTLQDIQNDLLLGDVNITLPYYTKTNDIIYKFTPTEQENIDTYHTGYIDGKKLLDSLLDKNDFTNLITKEELNYITGYDNLSDFEYLLYFINNLNSIIVSNSFVEPNRFKIYGIGIDIDNSDSNIISNIKTYDDFKKYVNSNKIKILPYPLPILIDKISNMNISTETAITKINNHFNIDNLSNILISDSTEYNLTNYKNAIIDYAINYGELSAYDKNIFELYNEQYKYNFNELLLKRKENMNYIYMIYDTYTEKYDLINIFDLNNIDYHYNKLNIAYNKNIKSVIKFYDSNPTDKIIDISGYINLQSGYTFNNKPIYYKKLELKNINDIIGYLEKVEIACNIFNEDTYVVSNTNLILDRTDFQINNNDLIFDFETILNSNEHIVDNLTYKIFINMEYKTFTYFNNFIIKYYTNFNNFISTTSVILTGYYYEDIINQVIKNVNVNIHENVLENILPQTIYSKNISLDIFDINDNIQEYYSDDKKCLIFDKYFNNYNTYNNINDSTIIDFNEFAIVNSDNIYYQRFLNKNNILPYLIEDNINKYIKIYIKFSLSEFSSNVESFTYTNLYNNTFDNEKGVVILDGKISDYTSDITTIDDLLKEYKINLNFTISNNVNNDIKIPVYIDIRYELFNTYNDYKNNIIYTYDTAEDNLLLDVKNRGNYILTEYTYSPKFVEYIEYFEIYPEYSQQKEELHNILLELKMTSKDLNTVKVSEVFFDVFNCTEDLFVAIPNNYKSYSDYNYLEAELTNIKQSNDKDDILNYLNYLLRLKCPNCGIANLKINIKNNPKYFGFNIASLLIGCYEYNIKFEQFIPYIFYKESANTTFIIDKKTTIEKNRESLSEIVKNDFQNNQSDYINSYYDNFLGSYSKDDLVNYIDKPIKTKNTLLLFNSSFNNKKISFELKENNSPKIISNTYTEYNISPLEFKILSLSENIDSTDYSDSYDSGIALYDLVEYDYKLDTTEIIDEVELLIPSLDDYIRSILNFIDKTAKIIQIDYEQNNFYIDESMQSNAYKQDKFIASTKISSTKSSILNIEKNNISDINYLFYINETYNINIDKSKLDNIISQTNQFGKNIYIKLPLIFPEKNSYIINYIDNLNNENINDSTTYINVNNLYDLDNTYLYLVGKQTNIDEYNFTLSGIISVSNETLLSNIINNYNIDNLRSFGISLNFKIIEPSILLSIFFKDYGDELSIYVANNFVGKDKIIDNNNISIISKMLDVISVDSENKSKNITKNIRLSGISKEETLPELTYEKIRDIKDTGYAEIYNKDLSGVYINSYLFPDKKLLETIDRFRSSLNKYLTTPDNTYISNIKNYDTQLFDDLVNTLNSNNFLNNTFSSNGVFKFNLKIILNNGIKTNHYISLNCDGNYDNIISANINSSLENNDGYEFYFSGDNNIYFNNEDNYLSIIFENLKQNTFQLVIDNNKYLFNNSPYNLYNMIQKKILQNPITIRTIDYTKYPIQIVSDTNYKLLFDIPVEIFKSVESYLTIDKIKISDNFITDTDYSIIFGDTNEIFNLKSNNEKVLKKTYYKYDKNSLKFFIKGFNIPNQTGQYYATIIIYYTFNGKNYTITKDIVYVINQANVLNNEYLLVNVERLDYVKNPIEIKTDEFGNTHEVNKGDTVNDDTVRILTDVYKGTSGCDLSYPDLKWFKNE